METITVWILSALLGNLDQDKLIWVIAVLAALYAFEQVIASLSWVKANSTCQLIFDILNALYAKFSKIIKVFVVLLTVLALLLVFATPQSYAKRAGRDGVIRTGGHFPKIPIPPPPIPPPKPVKPSGFIK
jgi:hypothetical protein